MSTDAGGFRDGLRAFGFELIDPVGSGAFGAVWNARQLVGPRPRHSEATPPVAPSTDGCLVAVKLIDETPILADFMANPDNGTSETARSEFLMEYRHFIRKEFVNCMKLRGNPNIVSVITTGSFQSPLSPELCECHFIAMELMKGTLSSILHDSAVTITDRLRLALDAVRATHYAHTKNVAHRDIKPENLLLANAPQRAIKMGDFGISVDYGLSAHPRSGIAFAGTKDYMAPEVFYLRDAGTAHISIERLRDIVNSMAWHKADVYSLGVTLYQLFMKAKPVSMNDDLNARFKKLKLKDYKRLGKVDGLPLFVADAVEAMMCPEADGRPQLSEVCDLLEAAVGECHASYGPRKEQVALNHTVTRLVRGALRKKIHNVVHEISPALAPPRDVSDVDSHWYLNVLLRPTAHPIDDRAPMSSYLCPVYGAHFVGSELKDWDHWDQSSDLLAKRVDISDSCCGLPIMWMQDKKSLVHRGILHSRRVMFPEYPDRSDVVSFVLIKDVKKERFGESPNPVVSKIYKTDRDRPHAEHGQLHGNGWNYRPVHNEDGPIHEMSQDIQTEIVVPIYGPSKRRHPRSPNDICGVLNIEWVWAPDAASLTRIEQYLVDSIHRDKLFPISEFLSEIVSIATTWRY